MEPLSSQELLDRIHAGDPDAFDHFVGAYGDRIYSFGMRVCGEPQDAREVAQDTLLQAFRSLKQVRDPAALRSWLYRVAANACLMKRRKRPPGKREVSLEELTPGHDGGEIEIPDLGPLPDEQLSRVELRAAVRSAIRDLPVPYRIVLILRDVEQLSTRETARALDLPEPTIKMRLHRARRLLRRSLELSLSSEGAFS